MLYLLSASEMFTINRINILLETLRQINSELTQKAPYNIADTSTSFLRLQWQTIDKSTQWGPVLKILEADSMYHP